MSRIWFRDQYPTACRLSNFAPARRLRVRRLCYVAITIITLTYWVAHG